MRLVVVIECGWVMKHEAPRKIKAPKAASAGNKRRLYRSPDRNLPGDDYDDFETLYSELSRTCSCRDGETVRGRVFDTSGAAFSQ